MSDPMAVAGAPRSRTRGLLIAITIPSVVLMVAGGYFLVRNTEASRLARSARARIVVRDYAKARSSLSSWLALDPNSSEAHYLLARVELGEGHPQTALNELAQAMELGHAPEVLAPYHAIVQSRGDQASQAEPVLRKALADSDAPQPEIAEALAKLYVRTVRFKEADDPLKRWMRDAPDDPRPYLLRNEIDMRRDADHAVLIQSFKAAIKRDPNLAEARLGLADRFLQAHRLDEAADEYDAYIRLKPEDPEGHVGAGKTALEQGKIDAAARHFDRALKRNPDEPIALKQLGQIDLNRGRFIQARDRLARAVALDPFDPVARFNLAQALRRTGDPAEAIKQESESQKLRGEHSRMADLRSELVKRPNDIPLRLEISQWLLDHGHDEEGLSFARKLLRDSPDHEPTIRMLVTYYLRKKDPGQANYYRLRLPRDRALKTGA